MPRQKTAHYLKATNGAQLPKRWAVFAVASEPGPAHAWGREMILRAWYGIELAQWHPNTPGNYVIRSESCGSDVASWHDWLRELLTEKARLDVWSCHTAPALAQLGMWRELEGGRWKLIERYERTVKDGEKEAPWTGQAVIGDPPTILVVRPHKGIGTVRLLDVRNLGAEGWEDLREPQHGSCRETVAEYLSRHSPIVGAQALALMLQNYLCKWIRTVKDECLGALKATAAAQAWEAFRYRFLDTPILCHNNAAAESLEMDSYHPGRAEAFRVGKIPGPIVQLDINSCYPAIMLETPMPVRLVKYTEQTPIDVAGYMDAGFEVIAECLIDTGLPMFPQRVNGEGIYPVGSFATTLAGPELRLAIRTGALVDVIRCAVYETSDRLASVAHWALQTRDAARVAGQLVRAQVAKLMINSLIGRFAQRIRQWQTLAKEVSEAPYWNRYEVNPDTKVLEHYRSIAYMVQKEVDLGLSPDAVAAIPATINSAARVKLWEMMEFCGRPIIFYVATDSLLTNSMGAKLLSKYAERYPGEPGRLKLVSEHEWIDIMGVGHVETDTTRKASGIPLAAEGTHASGFAWDSYERPTGALHRGKRPGALLVPRRASYRGTYRHGHLLQDGTVIPFRRKEF